MQRRNFLMALAAAAPVLAITAWSTSIFAETPTIDVYKSPTCGCCGDWIEHLEANGFKVNATNSSNMNAIKEKAGLSQELASCHTGFIDGYVIEGHVPASDIQRLLREKPAVLGLSVPGMVVGSPGMEMPGRAADPYKVVSFDAKGKTEVFNSYP